MYIELADTDASELLKMARTSEYRPTQDVKPEWKGKNKYLHGLLTMLTEGEALSIVESAPKDGMGAWYKLHERWHKAQKMSSTAIAERIRSISKAKSLDEVNPKLIELEKLYNEYYE
eukprot:7248159-Karenia_brevis.AAC.1